MSNNPNFPQRPATFPNPQTLPMMQIQPQIQQPLQQVLMPIQQQQMPGINYQAQPQAQVPQNFPMIPVSSIASQVPQFALQTPQFAPSVPVQQQFPIQSLQNQNHDKKQYDDDAKSDHSSELLDNLEELPPSHTIYLNNLNERVKVEDMKESLREVFEEYGTILQVISKGNIKMRGQAFIVFQDIQSAIDAKDQMQGAKIYGKAMRINFGRNKSDVISIAEGTYVKRDKSALTLREQIEKQKEEKQKVTREKLEKQILYQQQYQQQQSTSTSQTVQQHQPVQQPISQQKQPSRPQIIPHNILFVENLSPAVSQDTLQEIFLEVRLIQAKRVAFVEFEDEFQAGIAMSSLLGTQVLECQLQISFAKK